MKKKTNVKTLIRQIVREEVAMAIGEVVNELKQPSLSSKRSSQPKRVNKKVNRELNYSNNPIINEVLSQTEGGLPQGEGHEEYPTMGGGTYDSTRTNEVMSSAYGNMMNDQVNNSDVIAPGAPEGVKDIFDKDYSGILKASIKKSKGKK